MNIQDALRKTFDEVWRQQAHITGQADQINLVFPQNGNNLAVVPVLDTDTPDTLSEKILREEHRIYSEAVKIVLDGRFKIEGRRVIQLANQAAHR